MYSTATMPDTCKKEKERDHGQDGIC